MQHHKQLRLQALLLAELISYFDADPGNFYRQPLAASELAGKETG